VAVELESAALFALGAKRGVAAASLLIVSDIVPTRARIGSDDLRDAEHRAGDIALAALAAPA
jgi:purine-nucleoside phosphorylase